MTTAPLFTPDDLTTLATAVTYYGASVPHGMPISAGYVQQVAKLRSLQSRLQQWLDQQALFPPHLLDIVVASSRHELSGKPIIRLDESDLTNEG